MLSDCYSSTSLHIPSLSLNSLDLAGVRLLSPRDSQILPNSCRCRRCQCRWHNRAQVGVRWGTWSLLCFFSWWSVVEPGWDDRGSSIWGYLIFHLDLTVVGLCVDFGWCMNYIYVLCEVAIVSQLSLSHSYSLHGIVWRWPFLRQYLQCGYASKSCLDTWEI